MSSFTIVPISETALCVVFGNRLDKMIHQRLMALNKILLDNTFEGLVETVPAYSTLTVYYEPLKIQNESKSPYQWVKQYVENLWDKKMTLTQVQEKSLIQIPVCYDEEFGYDLMELADEKGVSKRQIIHWHLQEIYQVYMLGFTPGFAYMGEVNSKLATPRKKNPRTKVSAGSVGIAVNQTGIYPLDTPGGWQIIGRTPLTLFDLRKKNPFLLKAGDRVKFYEISREEFDKIQSNDYSYKNNIDLESPIGDVKVLKQGIFSTLQDKGRMGFQSFGVPISGAMDWRAYQYANYLVGNSSGAAVIECTMGSLSLLFQSEAEIALTGGGTSTLNGNAIEFYTSIPCDKNAILEIKYASNGLRTYLAVAGAWKGNLLMNSQSVYTKANVGSPLKNKQTLFFAHQAVKKRKIKALPSEYLNQYAHQKIRIIAGQELHWLKPQSLQKLYEQPFTLTHQCDRMGYKLQGEALEVYQERDLLSTAVSKGAVQCTPNGQLIILMNDAQTIGGYPRVGQVAYVDLPILAQLKPNDKIHFEAIAYEYAEALYLGQQKMWYELFD